MRSTAPRSVRIHLLCVAGRPACGCRNRGHPAADELARVEPCSQDWNSRVWRRAACDSVGGLGGSLERSRGIALTQFHCKLFYIALPHLTHFSQGH